MESLFILFSVVLVIGVGGLVLGFACTVLAGVLYVVERGLVAARRTREWARVRHAAESVEQLRPVAATLPSK
jgi:hypothetical protein